MYKIIKKEQLTSTNYLMEIEAPWIATNGKPGQFVIVIPREKGERVPLTIADINLDSNSITIVFQVVGDSTKFLSELNQGQEIFSIVGPLGKASELIEFSDEEMRNKRFLFIAGGVGIAPVYPQVKWMHQHGATVDVIMGARNVDLLFWEDKMRKECDNLYVMTDDGSYGEKGLVTTKIDQLVGEQHIKYDTAVSIGPLPMMKFCCLTTKKYDLQTIVSLNSMMVDGTGMCGACRVTVDGKVKFTCVDGPEFDGHQVDFDEAMKRLAKPDAKKYRIAHNENGHHCNLADQVYEQIAKEDNQNADPRYVMQVQQTRLKPLEQDPDARIHNFEEVSIGFTPDMAVHEARRCLRCKNPRCVTKCPVNIKIPKFLNAVANEDFEGAARILAQDSTLSAICGRVCPQETQCEGACLMNGRKQPLAIGALERFVADWAREHHIQLLQAAPANGHKVAIIGSGPSGLTCAGDLARMGYKVTIFEALHHAGGVLVYGIPEFRLPKQKIVQTEIDNLKRLGVDIQTNVIIGKSVTIDQLMDEHGFEAVYIASGAGLPKFMNIPGETLVGVIAANEILTRTNLMHGYDETYDTPIFLGKEVMVIGGGNVAMDAARTARRLGSNVTIVYRRGELDMPARKEELHHAKQEGIIVAAETNPVEILGDEQGNVRALKCVKMQQGELDAKGRRSYSAVEGSEFEIAADTVIMALGTSPNPLIKNTTKGLEVESFGGIKTDKSGATSRKGVFAGGDAVSGAATVILAMGAGRTAAKSIHEYISNK